jgi:hypothetical protein
MIHPKSVTGDYFRYFETKNWDDYHWAVDYVDDLVRDNPDEALTLTLSLVNASEPNKALAIAAAGPLENLLKDNGPALMDRIEEVARTNDKLRLALSGVWGINPGHPIYDRWYAMMQKYGFTDGRRAPL